MLRLSMFIRVGKCLLRDSIDTCFQSWGQKRKLIGWRIVIVELDSFLRCFLRESLSSFGQCAILQRSSTQIDHRTTRFFKIFASKVESTVNSLLSTFWIGACQRLGSFKLKSNCRHTLRKSIMNLACQAVAFFNSRQTCCGLGMLC